MKKKIAILLVVVLVLSLFAVQNKGEAEGVAKENVSWEAPKGSLLYSVKEESVQVVSPNDRVTSYKDSMPGNINELEASFDETGAIFGAEISAQMENYLSEKSDATAVVSVCEAEDAPYLSKVKFSLGDYTKYPLPSDSGQRGNCLLRWVFQAISSYSNLCTLNTSISYSTTRNGDNYYLNSITIYSGIAASEIKSITQKYEIELAKLVALPKQDATMTEVEKLFYLYNEIIALCTYPSGDLSVPSYHLATGLLLDHSAVCQAYAYVYNQAALELGLESLYMVSPTHAWNAIRLNGEWYYVDATWGDPSNGNISMVYKKYFLTDDMSENSNYVASHTLDGEMGYDTVYESILTGFGNSYDNYYPKQENLNNQMNYWEGNWYFTSYGTLYCWDGVSNHQEQLSDVSTDTNRHCDVTRGKLLYSGSDGLYVYNTDGPATQLLAIPMTYMVVQSNELCYQNNDNDILSRVSLNDLLGAEPTPTPTVTPEITPTPTPEVTPTPTPEVTSTPTPEVTPTPTPEVTPTPTPEITPTPTPKVTPTPTPEVTPTPTPEVTPTPTSKVTPTPTGGTSPRVTSTPMPTVTPEITPIPTAKPIVFPIQISQPIIKNGKNISKKAVRLKLKKMNDVTGYQVYYATNKRFKSKKKKNVKKTTFIIRKLKKRFYYFKVRGYVIYNGEKIYGTWSKVKRIKVRK